MFGSGNNLSQSSHFKKLGNVQFGQGNFSAALTQYTLAIGADPSPVHYSNRASAHLQLGRLEDAKCDALFCVKLDSEYFRGYHRMSEICYRLGEYDEANVWMDKALKRLDDTTGKHHKVLKKLQEKIHQRQPPVVKKVLYANAIRDSKNDLPKILEFVKTDSLSSFQNLLKEDNSLLDEIFNDSHNLFGECIIHDRVEFVRHLLSLRDSFFLSLSGGMNWLQLCMLWKSPQTLLYLCQHVKKHSSKLLQHLNRYKTSSQNMFHLCVPLDNAECLKIVLEQFPTIFESRISSMDSISHSQERRNLLMFASETGAERIVSLLLSKYKKFISINKKSTVDGRTALNCCAIGNELHKIGSMVFKPACSEKEEICVHARICKSLLKAGADVRAKTEEGSTVFGTAMYHGHLQVVKFLCETGEVRVTEEELSKAIAQNHLGCVKYVLDQKRFQRKLNLNWRIQISEMSQFGGVCLLGASMTTQNYYLVKYLLEKGCDPNYLPRNAPISLLLQGLSMGNHHLVELLLQFGAKPSSDVGPAGTLCGAILMSNIESLKILLKYHRPSVEEASYGLFTVAGKQVRNDLEKLKMLISEFERIFRHPHVVCNLLTQKSSFQAVPMKMKKNRRNYGKNKDMSVIDLLIMNKRAAMLKVVREYLRKHKFSQKSIPEESKMKKLEEEERMAHKKERKSRKEHQKKMKNEILKEKFGGVSSNSMFSDPGIQNIVDDDSFNKRWKTLSQSERKKEVVKLLSQIRSGNRRNRILGLKNASEIITDYQNDGGQLLLKMGYVDTLLQIIKQQVVSRKRNKKKKKNEKDLDLTLFILSSITGLVESRVESTNRILNNGNVKKFIWNHSFLCNENTTKHLCLSWSITLRVVRTVQWKTTRRRFCEYFEVPGRGIGKRIYTVFEFLVSHLHFVLKNRNTRSGIAQMNNGVIHWLELLLPNMYQTFETWWKNDMKQNSHKLRQIAQCSVKFLRSLVVLMNLDRSSFPRINKLIDLHKMEVLIVIENISWEYSELVMTKEYALDLYNFVHAVVYCAPKKKEVGNGSDTVLTSGPHCDEKNMDIVLGGLRVLSSIYQRSSPDVLVSTFRQAKGLLLKKVVIPLVFFLSPDEKILSGKTGRANYTNITLLNFCFRILWDPLNNPFIRIKFDQEILRKLLLRLITLWTTCVKRDDCNERIRNEDVISFYRHLAVVIHVLHSDDRHETSTVQAEKVLAESGFLAHLARIFPFFPPRAQGNFLAACLGSVVGGTFLNSVDGEDLKVMLSSIIEGMKVDESGILQTNGRTFLVLLKKQMENGNERRDTRFDETGVESVLVVIDDMLTVFGISKVQRKSVAEEKSEKEKNEGMTRPPQHYEKYDPRNSQICDGCKRLFMKNLKRCSRCRLVLYCSRECQIKNWKEHKKICKKK